ncbi:MAG: hypothetical protein J1F18_04365 [Lachnospiraceae bacterium]|nr:hypothetical protein [Lachnospiraceae bacterium]
MNINGLGNLYDRTYETYQSSKYAQSFSDFLDKVNEDKSNVTDMSTKESSEEKSDDKKDMPEEEGTRTEIVVRPDGSKVLMITVSVGGQDAVTSVELAKPTGEDIPSRDISGDTDMNDTVDKLEARIQGEQ